MYCGSDYSEATSCGSPCPLGGGIGECPDGQSCWAEVECNPWAAADTTTTQLTSVEVTVEIDDNGNDEPISEDSELSDVTIDADDAEVIEPMSTPQEEEEPDEELSDVSEISIKDAVVEEPPDVFPPC